MSEIASFTYLRAADVPFLGLWSKPQPRFFRKPICKFSEFLQEHALRELIFDGTDGVYISLVFAWLETSHRAADKEDPVIRTVRKNIGGCHWLIKHTSPYVAAMAAHHFQPEALISFSTEQGPETGFNPETSSLNLALSYVEQRLSEITAAQALLVSVG